MNRTISFALLMGFVISTSVFAALNLKIASAYASQVVEGHRVVIEESKKINKIRYETVLRDGYDEIVKVVAPTFFEWAYLNGKTYIVFGNEMKRSPAPIVDLERTFFKSLSSTPTILSTAVINYKGEKAYKIELSAKEATYTGVVLIPSFLLVNLNVQRDDKTITITYNSINKVPALYFKNVISRFKILSTPPSTMEVEVWKMVYHLDDVSVTSIKINSLVIVLVHGRAKGIGDVLVYLFKKNDKISTKNLASQFTSKGFYSISAQQNGISMVFVSPTKEIEKFKEWVDSLLDRSKFR